ncbi:putative ribonuclease H-like domain-containing protein [Tanacetum coccineum]
MIPFCTTDPLISQGPKDSEEDVGMKPTKVNESGASDKGEEDEQDIRSEFERLLQKEKQTNSTNSFNTVGTPVSAAGPSFTNDDPSLPVNAAEASNAFEDHLFERFSPFKNAFALLHVPNVFSIDDNGIFGNAYDDEDVGAEADLNNLETTMNASLIPTTRIDKDHPKDHIIRDLNSAIQTRRMTKISNEHAMKVWILVDLHNGKRAIGTKWVFRNKKDDRGIIVRNKARLVAQGYTQEEGIDYDEGFAPVARIEAIRLFLAYASYMGFIVHKMDVKCTFLYGTIEEEVYVCQNSGFEDPHFPNKVYKVEKALYGLHQAPRAWYETLSTYLLENRFRRGTIDKTLFIKKDKSDILLVQVNVDDIIFGSTKKTLCLEFEQMIHNRFQMSSMGDLTFFLGLQVQQKEDGIFISQDKYVAEILKKFDFATVKTTSTPIETNKVLVKDEEAKAVHIHLYRSMIGSLMYLTASRPDITFAVCACARFQVTPKVLHLHTVKRIFRYLKGQPKLGLWYPRDSSFDLEAFYDTDYAGAILDRKAKRTTEISQSSGPIHLVVNETVYKEWKDRMERAITTASSLEAEQDSEAQTRFEVASKQSNDPPLSRVYTLGSGEDSMKLNELMELCTKFSRERQLQALVDKKKVIITETSIRSDLNLEDAGGTNCLSTDTIFEELARMGTSTEPMTKKETNEEFVPTHSYDPSHSGEDRLQLHELMNLCTKLSDRVLALETTKTTQAFEIASLVGSTRRVKSSNDEGLGAQEDASKQRRSIEDIDKDAEVSLVDETQGRSDDTKMFDTYALIGDEVFAENDMTEKEHDVIPKEVSAAETFTTAGIKIPVSTAAPSTTAVSPPVITESTVTTAPSTILKAKGITFRDAGETTTRTSTSVSSSSIKDKGKAKMVEPEVPLNKKDC